MKKQRNKVQSHAVYKKQTTENTSSFRRQEWKKIYHANSNHNRARAAIPLLDKIDLN